MTPEDLFAAFFGGGPTPFHGHHHGHRGHHHDDGQMQRVQIFQALPVLLLVPLEKEGKGFLGVKCVFLDCIKKGIL